jgi:hypothetical protein
MSALDSDTFLRALRGLIRPLVRTLISRGVPAPAFYKLLKTVYVEVANQDFRIDDQRPTDSRITLLTGVHRRDVKDILANPDTTWESTRAKTATMATVVGQWIARPEYQSETGAPKALPRTSEDGESFENLVRLVNTDIRPRTVFDELLRQGLIVEDDDGLLRIADIAVMGPASDDHKLVFFASNVGDHMAAASENLLSETPPFFERAVFYNALSPASVDAVEGDVRTQAQAFLETVNDKSSALQKDDRQVAGPKERFRFGVYFYREPTPLDDTGNKARTNTNASENARGPKGKPDANED